MATPDGGYPSPVTSYERRIPVHRRAPECVDKSIANGQQPTEPIKCEPVQKCNGPDFGPHSPSAPEGRNDGQRGGRGGRGPDHRPPRSRQRVRQYQWAGKQSYGRDKVSVNPKTIFRETPGRRGGQVARLGERRWGGRGHKPRGMGIRGVGYQPFYRQRGVRHHRRTTFRAPGILTE